MPPLSEKRVGGNYTVQSGSVWYYIRRFRKIKLMNIISEVLKTMNLIDVDEVEVEKVALTYKLSFYDASYVRLAIDLSLPLVKEKAKGKINVTDEVT